MESFLQKYTKVENLHLLIGCRGFRIGIKKAAPYGAARLNRPLC